MASACLVAVTQLTKEGGREEKAINRFFLGPMSVSTFFFFSFLHPNQIKATKPERTVSRRSADVQYRFVGETIDITQDMR